MFVKHVTGVVIALGIAGCTNTQPVYHQPAKTEPSEIAVCKSFGGTYIHEVDGEHVQSSNLPLSNLGGNEITTTPGNHRFMVEVHAGSPFLISPVGPLMAVDIAAGVQNNRHTFWFKCEKGHTYAFSRRNLFTSKLKVTDHNTGRSLDIE